MLLGPQSPPPIPPVLDALGTPCPALEPVSQDRCRCRCRWAVDRRPLLDALRDRIEREGDQ